MSTTPSFDSLMAQARAALVELDQAIEVDEAERAALDTRLAERRAMRRQIATIVGERPAPRPKGPAAVSSSGAFKCGCGRSFPTKQGLSMHRTRAGHGESDAIAPLAPRSTPERERIDKSSPVPPPVYDQLERDVLRMWAEHSHEDAERRFQLIADATGRRLPVVREIGHRLGLVA